MSFSLAIALIVVADIALIAGLAFVMSRASRLTPHVSRRAASAASAADGGLSSTRPTARTPLRPEPHSAPARGSRVRQPSAA
jgi:hypothetical protein